MNKHSLELNIILRFDNNIILSKDLSSKINFSRLLVVLLLLIYCSLLLPLFVRVLCLVAVLQCRTKCTL